MRGKNVEGLDWGGVEEMQRSRTEEGSGWRFCLGGSKGAACVGQEELETRHKATEKRQLENAVVPNVGMINYWRSLAALNRLTFTSRPVRGSISGIGSMAASYELSFKSPLSVGWS